MKEVYSKNRFIPAWSLDSENRKVFLGTASERDDFFVCEQGATSNFFTVG